MRFEFSAQLEREDIEEAQAALLSEAMTPDPETLWIYYYGPPAAALAFFLVLERHLAGFQVGSIGWLIGAFVLGYGALSLWSKAYSAAYRDRFYTRILTAENRVFRYVVDQSGVSYETDTLHTKMTWSGFDRVREGVRVIHLWHRSGVSVMFARRAVGDDRRQSELVAFINAQLAGGGGAKPVHS